MMTADSLSCNYTAGYTSVHIDMWDFIQGQDKKARQEKRFYSCTLCEQTNFNSSGKDEEIKEFFERDQLIIFKWNMADSESNKFK